MNAAQDDEPIEVEDESVSVSVDEDFHHHHGRFHFGFDHFDDTRFSIAQLQDLVDVGADGPALFSLDTSISGPVKLTDGTLATSNGVQIDFAASASGHRVIGFADTDGDGSRDPGEHVVFRLVDEGSRGFDFDLKGEVDHPASDGSSGAAVPNLDLTPAFSATDSNGDPVTLAANSIVADLGEANSDDNEPHEHEPHEHGQGEHGPHEQGQGEHEPGQDTPGQDEPGQHEPAQDEQDEPAQHNQDEHAQHDQDEHAQHEQDEHAQHEEGSDQATPHLASLLTGLAGEAGHHRGDRADDRSHGGNENDALADLAADDAFVFNKEFTTPHLLAAADKFFEFLEELAVNVPPLQTALTELEGRLETIANALQEHLPKHESSANLHQDNFVL